MKFRLESFPLKWAAKRTVIRAARRARRHGHHRKAWWREKTARWNTVQLARTSVGWMLAYEGKPCTGPFNTRMEAIDWYAQGGR